MNTLASIVEYHAMAWSDVAFMAVIGLTIVGVVWAAKWRKP